MKTILIILISLIMISCKDGITYEVTCYYYDDIVWQGKAQTFQGVIYPNKETKGVFIRSPNKCEYK